MSYDYGNFNTLFLTGKNTVPKGGHECMYVETEKDGFGSLFYLKIF